MRACACACFPGSPAHLNLSDQGNAWAEEGAIFLLSFPVPLPGGRVEDWIIRDPMGGSNSSLPATLAKAALAKAHLSTQPPAARRYASQAPRSETSRVSPRIRGSRVGGAKGGAGV